MKRCLDVQQQGAPGVDNAIHDVDSKGELIVPLSLEAIWLQLLGCDDHASVEFNLE